MLEQFRTWRSRVVLTNAEVQKSLERPLVEGVPVDMLEAYDPASFDSISFASSSGAPPSLLEAAKSGSFLHLHSQENSTCTSNSILSTYTPAPITTATTTTTTTTTTATTSVIGSDSDTRHVLNHGAEGDDTSEQWYWRYFDSKGKNLVYDGPLRPRGNTIKPREYDTCCRRCRGKISTIFFKCINNGDILGLALNIGAAFILSVVSLLVKILNTNGVSPLVCVFTRGIVQTTFTLICLAFLRISPLGPRKYWFPLALRGFFGALGLSGYFVSISFLPLSDAVVINLTTAIFTALWAFVLLKEKIGIIEVLAMILSLIGVVLIVRPPVIFRTAENTDVVQRLIGASVGLLSAILMALAFALTRKVAHAAHQLVFVFYQSLGCLVVPLPLSFIKSKPYLPQTDKDWILLTVLGVISFVAQVLINKSLQLGRAGRVTVGSYFQVLFSLVWSIAVLHVTPFWTSIVGAVLIASNAVITTWKGWKSIIVREATAVELETLSANTEAPSTNNDEP
ncbi:solute carrier family 35 member G1 [Pelomyxa schiedti]|nr:solute carrier family 35 member G1 [Pelomyxa schiedti]